MDLPAFVPESLESAPVGGRQLWCLFPGNRERLVPREEATTSFVRSLSSLATTEALHVLGFTNMYFEMASIISALQQNLDRLLDRGCNFKDIEFVQCDSEVEMAIRGLLKFSCQSLELNRQRLTFTPDLAEALRKESASLEVLYFHTFTFIKQLWTKLR
jgi:hypothetical protein